MANNKSDRKQQGLNNFCLLWLKKNLFFIDFKIVP